MTTFLMRIAYSKRKVDVLKNSVALARFHLYSPFNKNENEERIKKLLLSNFPNAKVVEVCDISGGCGAMYEISVEAPQFRGLSTVKQHKLVTEALKEEIKDMHGLRISTVPV